MKIFIVDDLYHVENDTDMFEVLHVICSGDTIYSIVETKSIPYFCFLFYGHEGEPLKNKVSESFLNIKDSTILFKFKENKEEYTIELPLYKSSYIHNIENVISDNKTLNQMSNFAKKHFY